MTGIKSLMYLAGLLFGGIQVFSQKQMSVAFDVQVCDRNTVMIQSTRPESDSFEYVLEKSWDDKNWERIADIKSQLLPYYDYIDLDATSTLGYYRIAQRKHGQLVAVSETKSVQVGSPAKLYLWPTPANDILHVQSPFVNGNIDIIDGDGRLVRKMTVTDPITHVQLQALPAGMYFIRLRHGNDILVERFIKQRGF
jgi:type IX secretion system substrate protein